MIRKCFSSLTSFASASELLLLRLSVFELAWCVDVSFSVVSPETDLKVSVSLSNLLQR